MLLSKFVFAWLLLSVGVAPGALKGAEIFKWVDDEGVTHYSEDRPPPSVTEFKALEFQNLSASQSSPSPRDAADADYFSVINQAKRMEASRLERERLKLEQHKLRQQRNSQQGIVIQDYTTPRRSYSVVYPRYDRFYSIYPYHHKYYYSVPHHKKHGSRSRLTHRAGHRLSRLINGRRHGYRNHGVLPRSIRLR